MPSKSMRAAKPIRILVIEDDEISRRLICNILRSLGYQEIEEAADGAQGWSQIGEALLELLPFDVVISDWDMPNSDGIKLLKKVRSQEVTRSLPFILLTGHNEREKIIEAKRAGVTDYIAKPFAADVFSEKIRKILAAVGRDIVRN